MIVLSVDVTQIDRNRLKVVTKRNGDVAKYLELVLIPTPGGQYGDYIVKQGVTKEERAARKEMPILGNGKNVGSSGSVRQSHPQGGGSVKHSAPAEPETKEDDIPF